MVRQHARDDAGGFQTAERLGPVDMAEMSLNGVRLVRPYPVAEQTNPRPGVDRIDSRVASSP